METGEKSELREQVSNRREEWRYFSTILLFLGASAVRYRTTFDGTDVMKYLFTALSPRTFIHIYTVGGRNKESPYGWVLLGSFVDPTRTQSPNVLQSGSVAYAEEFRRPCSNSGPSVEKGWNMYGRFAFYKSPSGRNCHTTFLFGWRKWRKRDDHSTYLI